VIQTFSKFYYGHQVTTLNLNIAFDEGGPELNAAVQTGSYTLSEFTVAVQNALNAAGANAYTVTVDRDSRIITIAADGVFDLLIASGATIDTGLFSLLGFTGADLTGLTAYSGNNESGKEYRPQFRLQSYVDRENFQEAQDASVNVSATGAVEVVSFGINEFFEMDIKFITNLEMDGKVIRNNPTGLEDALELLQDISLKNRFEFMPDADDSDSFSKVILESLPSNKKGTGYKLKELFTKNIPDIYETGLLKLRVVT
jgi:hypothetical protein